MNDDKPYPGSIIALDCKAELTAITALYRSEVLKQKVCILDPFKISPPWVSLLKCSFNPVTILTNDLGDQ